MSSTDRIRPWAVMLEVVGWLGLGVATFVGGWIVVTTIEVCEDLAPLQGQHAGCGIDVALAGVALAVVGVIWLVAAAFVLGGRRWRRPRSPVCGPGVPPPMPPWWYPPH